MPYRVPMIYTSPLFLGVLVLCVLVIAVVLARTLARAEPVEVAPDPRNRTREPSESPSTNPSRERADNEPPETETRAGSSR